MASYSPITNKLNFAVAFNPTTAFPLDARSMFGSYGAAEAAAASAKNAGSSESVYYYGQILTVFENDVAKHYSIQGDNTLKEVGATVIGDNKTIVVQDSVLSLKDFGTQYYAFHPADTIIEANSYTSPSNMPSTEQGAVEGAYVQATVEGGDSTQHWFKYTGGSWSQVEEEPHTQSYYTLTQGWKAGLEPKVVSVEGNQYALAWYEPSTTTVEGLQSIVSGLQTETEGLTDRVGTLETDVEDVEGRVDTLETDVTAAEGKITTLEGAVNTLNGGAETPGSVAKQVNDAIAAVVANAPEDFDTLKEMSDWISSHSDDASAMNSQIQTNKQNIQNLQTLVGTIPEEATSSDIVSYISEVVDAADEAMDTRVSSLESTVGGLGTAANSDVEDFATAEQGAKADSAVQSVTAGTNGHILVDSADVKVYEPTTATSEAAGISKPDGTSLTVVDGTMSVLAVDSSKVTGLDNKINTATADALQDAKDYTDENAVLTSDVVASGAQAEAGSASDTKVASEKLVVDAMTWKTTM